MALQLDDIQGVILHGYGALEDAAFLLLTIDDVAAAKRWLSRLPLRDSTVRPEVTDTCTNIAFTPSGLARLGLAPEHLGMLAGEFREGMSGTEHRRRILGDHGDSCPSSWRWNGLSTS